MRKDIAEITVLDKITYANDRSISIAEVENPDPICDTIGIVVDGVLILAMTPDEFVEFVTMGVRLIGHSFRVLHNL
jgi:hypothetical protein